MIIFNSHTGSERRYLTLFRAGIWNYLFRAGGGRSAPPCIFHIYYCWDLKIGRGVKKDLNKHPWKLESDPTILKPSRGRVVTGGHGGYNLEGQCFFAITQKVGVVDCWYSVFRDPWQISCKIGENLVQFGQKQFFFIFLNVKKVLFI